MNSLNGIISEERRYASIPYTETGNNHQIFSDIVNSYGLAGCQNQAWCATYQFALELLMYGKGEALKHWNMSSESYVGYNCFSTEAAFIRAKKNGSNPKLGALVIFKRSHMGRVLSINSTNKTFECGEGNTSNKQYDRNGDSCAVKTYGWNDPGIKSFCYIDYGGEEMTTAKLTQAVSAVYQMAHNQHFRYGDSKTLPPCADGIISCDRLIARALWNLGYQSQPKGGITVINMESYLTKWGFSKVTSEANVKAGDIVLMKQNGTSTPNAAWHTFYVTAVTKSGSTITVNKYDCGSQQRIDSPQPFVGVPLNQWQGQRSFYCAFRYGKMDTDYTFTPTDLKKGSKSNSAYLATEILKARNYQGVKDKNGKVQDLELNFDWTKGDMAAMAHYKWGRIVNGKNLCSGPYGAGEVGPSDWIDLLGSKLPFVALELPTKQKSGICVLICQEILRARGVKGKDGKPIALTSKWDENLEHAVRTYQRVRKLKETGKVTYEVWKDMLNI